MKMYAHNFVNYIERNILKKKNKFWFIFEGVDGFLVKLAFLLFTNFKLKYLMMIIKNFNEILRKHT